MSIKKVRLVPDPEIECFIVCLYCHAREPYMKGSTIKFTIDRACELVMNERECNMCHVRGLHWLEFNIPALERMYLMETYEREAKKLGMTLEEYLATPKERKQSPLMRKKQQGGDNART